VTVLLSGNVADPVGSVSCRSSASGSDGEKLIEAALFVLQVSVVSCPGTIVCGLAESVTLGPVAAGGFVPSPTDLVCGASGDGPPAHPAQNKTMKTAATVEID
jgi:hypothetical protein